MKKLSVYLLLLALPLLTLSCVTDKEDYSHEGMRKVEFTENPKETTNPERGMYMGIVYPIDPTPSAVGFSTNRKYGITVWLLEVSLKDYRDTDELPKDFLDGIQSILDKMRDGGVKCVIRFAYTFFEEDEEPWDAPIARVLGHIRQVKPLLQDNADVIMALQAGFVGLYGEWYYTTNLGSDGAINLEARNSIITALLDAVPARRQVQLRTPSFKTRFLGTGMQDSITAAEAYGSNPKARLGFHNDCFLADGTDVGTFSNASEKKLMINDSRYTFMGGETCKKSNHNKCDNSLVEMEKQHFSYLNCLFEENVIKRWREEGCYDEISRRLGYRFVLENAWVDKKVEAGKDFNIEVNFRNDGFASPQNPRNLEIVFEDAAGGKTAGAIDDDPRFWEGGEKHTIEIKVKAPAAGEYKVYLNLPDPEESLKDNPLYSIAFSNKDVWDKTTGFNKLFTLNVE